MIPTREQIFKWIGKDDYQLEGFIRKSLTKSEKNNGPQFLDALLQELNHNYETGYHKGFNAWTSLKRCGPKTPIGVKCGMWNKFYNDACQIVAEKRELDRKSVV